MIHDVVIIGGGPTGLTAGLYAARAGLQTVLVERAMPGGQAATTEIIENYPGFPEGISGPELMAKFHAQAERFGVEIKYGEVIGLELEGPVKKVETHDEVLQAKTVIIASGAKPRSLGAKGEEEFRGRGVSYCATCDGAFFRDRKVIVVGGGNAAVEEALFLTKFASQVTIVHRRDQLRASKVAQDRAAANPKIQFIWNAQVEEIQGNQGVEKVILRDVKTGERREVATEGVFVFVGTAPSIEFLENKVECNAEGYIVVNDHMATSVPGVFAAGDIRDSFLRQVATAVGDGAMAAMAAEKYLADQE